MSAEPLLDLGCHRLTKSRPVPAAASYRNRGRHGGYTLAAGPVRADAIKTDTTASPPATPRSRWPMADARYFARPDGGANPPASCWWRWRFRPAEYIKDVTRAASQARRARKWRGLLFPEGRSHQRSRHSAAVADREFERMPSSFRSRRTVAWAKSQGVTPHGSASSLLSGGRTVWEYSAHNPALKAGAAFYGPPVDAPNPLWPKSPTQLAPEMKAPVLGLYGEPIPHSRRFRGSLEGSTRGTRRPPNSRLSRARARFHADYRASYRKEAADDAWRRCRPGFKEVMACCS